MFDLDDLTDGERERAIQEGLAIEAMTQTEGWKLVEKAIDDRMNSLRETLVLEKDFNNVVRLQEAIKWGMALKNFVSIKISNAKVLQNETRYDE